MPTKGDLPDPQKLVNRVVKSKDIRIEPETQDASEFLQNVCKLPRSKRVEILFGPTLFDYQRKMVDVNAWREHTRCVAPIGRRGGKTFCGSLIGADAPLAVAAGEDTLISAPYQSTADEMMDGATRWYRESPWPDHFGLSPNEFFGITKDNKRTYKFANGSRLMSKTTGDTGKQIRGLGPQVIIYDEAAFVNDDSIFTDVIESMFAEFTGDMTGFEGFEDRPQTTEFYLYSTTNGKSGYFYEKSVDATEDGSRWFRFNWPTSINPMVADSFIEQKREEWDSLTFDKEILAVFTDEGEVYIKHADAKACQVGPDAGPPDFAPPEVPCYGAIDPARGGDDETAAVMVDGNGAVRVHDVIPENSIPEVVGLMQDMNQTHAPEEIYVEGNAVGGGAVDFAPEYGIKNVGEIKSSLKTKNEYYQLLKKRIEERSLTLPRHAKLMSQLTDLGYTNTPSGYVKVHHREENKGDDIPDALAMACYAAGGNAPTSRPYRTNSYTPVTG